jgi:hypothetical protein
MAVNEEAACNGGCADDNDEPARVLDDADCPRASKIPLKGKTIMTGRRTTTSYSIFEAYNDSGRLGSDSDDAKMQKD